MLRGGKRGSSGLISPSGDSAAAPRGTGTGKLENMLDAKGIGNSPDWSRPGKKGRKEGETGEKGKASASACSKMGNCVASQL